MARPLPFPVFKRILRRYGISIKQGSKATHFKLGKVVAGKRRIYTIAVHDNQVLGWYIHKVRRIFQLLPEDGVSDRDFLEK